MKISWKKNKNLNPQILIDKVFEIATIRSDGNVGYETFKKFEIDSVIMTMLDFGKSYSFYTAKQFYDTALNSCIRSSKKSKEELISEINNMAILFDRKREITYILATSISSYTGFFKANLTVGIATIRCWPKGLPKKYNTRDMHKWNRSHSALPEGYCPVTVTIKAKDSREAFHKAMYELDYCRGTHALFVNPASEINFMGNTPRPLNKILLGGMHSLHEKSGKLVNENVYWYERYTDQPKPIDIKKKPISGSVDYLLKSIARCPDKHLLKDAIIRYVRAFDEVDKNTVIQKTWAALEALAASGENNADSIVRRCSYIFEERAYHKQILEHLREYRNRNIHNGEEIEEPEFHCYQIQTFFRQLVLFYAANADFFASLDEANKFLDLSDSISVLTRNKELIEKALVYIKPKDETD
jgi:hypothetical protein